jgi:membrane protein implicated in regulation of membrane protease activity
MLDMIFLIAAVVGSTVMVCQFVLTLMGLGDDVSDGGGHVGHVDSGVSTGDVAGHDLGDTWGSAQADVGDGAVIGDHHTSVATAADGQIHHPDSSWLFGVLSFRTMVTAAAFFGLAGLAAKKSGFAPTSSILVGVLAGVAAMYGMYWLTRSISMLNSSGNQRIGNAVGRRATVYIPIPAEQKGAGKVQLSMQNRIVEYQAVTDESEKLKTGEAVEVVGVAGSDTVCVRRAVETAPV